MQSINPPNCPYCHHKSKLIQTGLYDDRYGAPGQHNVYQCRQCGYGQTLPGLTKSSIGNFYKRYYPLNHVNLKTLVSHPQPPTSVLRWILGLGHTCHWHTKPGMKVLDIGSGSGRSLIEINAMGGDAYGVEPDPTAQQIARKLKLRVHQGFITDKPFPGIKFDLITASQVIEHEPDPLSFLRSAHSKLKVGGKLILSTPNLSSMGRKLYGPRWINWHIPYHLSFFSKATFIQLAKSCGYKVITIKTVTPTLWSVIQWEMLSNPIPAIGKSNEVWTGYTNYSRYTYLRKLIYYALAVPYSRIVDCLGFGESLVVLLKRI